MLKLIERSFDSSEPMTTALAKESCLMKSHSVRFEIDELPLALKHHGSRDYIGQYIGAAASPPLLRRKKSGEIAQSLVIPEFEIGPEARNHFKFRIDTTKCWSDGRRLTGADLVSGLRDARRRDPYWAHHLRMIANLSCSEDSVTIDTKRPLRHLPNMLCASELSPSWSDIWDCGVPSLGPYFFVGTKDATNLHFLPNPAWPEARERPALSFLLNRRVESVPKRFQDGEIDVTCSTMFPLDLIDTWRSRGVFHNKPAPIWMQLEFGASLNPILLRREIRQALSAAIDRQACAKSLFDGITPRQGLFETGSVEEKAYSQLANGKQLPQKLRMSYYDYYPNWEVATFICSSWKSTFDVDVDLIPVSFASPLSEDCDLRLELRYPIFSSPVAEIESAIAMLTRVGSNQDIRRAIFLFDLLQHGTAHDYVEAVQCLIQLLADTVPVIPLFNLKHHWLMNARVANFTLPFLENHDFEALRLSTR